MKLDKAIEVNQTMLTPDPQFSPELREKAIKLGIEALKFTLAVRGTILSYATLPLPGETED